MDYEVDESISKKVIEKLEATGSSKVWLAKKMEMTTATLHKRLREGNWSLGEKLMLKHFIGVE